MKRRQYLVAGATSLGFLAGCTDEGTETETTATGDHLKAAGDRLEQAGEAFETQADAVEAASVDDGGVDVSTTEVEGHLDAAEQRLDAAEAGATDRQREKIDAGRGAIAFLRAAIEFLDVFAEGYTETAVGFSEFDSERWTDAADTLETAETRLGEADDELTIVRDRADALGDVEGVYDEVDLATLRSDLDDLDAILETLVPFADAFGQVALGMADYETATEAFEDEAYGDAKTSFEAASTHLADAERTFTDLESSAPDSLRADIVDITCVASSTGDAASHYETAAQALEEGDTTTAEDAIDDAERALDRCSTGA